MIIINWCIEKFEQCGTKTIGIMIRIFWRESPIYNTIQILQKFGWAEKVAFWNWSLNRKLLDEFKCSSSDWYSKPKLQRKRGMQLHTKLFSNFQHFKLKAPHDNWQENDMKSIPSGFFPAHRHTMESSSLHKYINQWQNSLAILSAALYFDWLKGW